MGTHQLDLAGILLFAVTGNAKQSSPRVTARDAVFRQFSEKCDVEIRCIGSKYRVFDYA